MFLLHEIHNDDDASNMSVTGTTHAAVQARGN